MTTESRLNELALSWQERKWKGQPASPEDLCADCPDLLPALRERLARMQAMDEFLASTPKPATDLESTLGRDSTYVPRPQAATNDSPSVASSSRYGVLRFHAKGGLGEVYLAQDAELGREVALKRIQPRYAADAESRQRFQREAEITARLAHPGIVPVYGLVHDADGRPCYAMRFIEGESLAEAITRLHTKPDDSQPVELDYRGLPFRQLLQKFVTICNTLAYAHSKGVIHRDVKPQNVMLGPYGESLVVDWGLAKLTSDESQVTSGEPKDSSTSIATGDSELHTEVGRAMGTLAYMSPEQAAGRWHQVGPASDVYSLGATLYHLLTGQSPLTGLQVAEALQAVGAGRFPPPRDMDKRMPRALEAICLKAMALKPADRYPGALELATDVEAWLADEPVQAWREPWTGQARRWGRRHRTLVTTVTAVLMVAVIALVVTLFIFTDLNHQLESKNTDLILTAERTERGYRGLYRNSRTLITLHSRMGDQGLHEGDLEAVERELRAALLIQQNVVSEFPLIPEARQVEADIHADLGLLLTQTARSTEARSEFDAAWRILEELALENPANLDIAVDRAWLCTGFARLEGLAIQKQGMLDWTNRGIEITQSVLARDSRHLEAREALWRLIISRAGTLHIMGQTVEAVRDHNLGMGLNGNRPPRDLSRFLILATLRGKLTAQARQGDPTGAIASARTILADSFVPADTKFVLAAVYAVAAAVFSQNGTPTEEHERDAVELLQEARRGGYFKGLRTPVDFGTDQDFKALLARSDFQQFLSDLAKPP